MDFHIVGQNHDVCRAAGGAVEPKGIQEASALGRENGGKRCDALRDGFGSLTGAPARSFPRRQQQDFLGCHRQCEFFAHLRPKTPLWSALKEPLAKADAWHGLVATTARTGFADHVANFPELKAEARRLYGGLSAKGLTEKVRGPPLPLTIISRAAAICISRAESLECSLTSKVMPCARQPHKPRRREESKRVFFLRNADRGDHGAVPERHAQGVARARAGEGAVRRVGSGARRRHHRSRHCRRRPPLPCQGARARGNDAAPPAPTTLPASDLSTSRRSRLSLGVIAACSRPAPPRNPHRRGKTTVRSTRRRAPGDSTARTWTAPRATRGASRGTSTGAASGGCSWCPTRPRSSASRRAATSASRGGCS